MEIDTRSLIAMALVLAMISMAFVLVFRQPPDSDIFKVLIGGLMTVGFSSIINFYFGSSTGSKAKDDALIEMSKNGAHDENPNPPHVG